MNKIVKLVDKMMIMIVSSLFKNKSRVFVCSSNGIKIKNI